MKRARAIYARKQCEEQNFFEDEDYLQEESQTYCADISDTQISSQQTDTRSISTPDTVFQRCVCCGEYGESQSPLFSDIENEFAIKPCPICNDLYCEKHMLQCEVCEETTCKDCISIQKCEHCSEYTSCTDCIEKDHYTYCEQCNIQNCENGSICTSTCEVCDKDVCEEDLLYCRQCWHLSCYEHYIYCGDVDCEYHKNSSCD
jgi:hypothetical protein